MKILYVAHEGGGDFNGASRSLLSMVDYFQEKHEIFVLVPYSYGKLYEELKKRKCRIIIQKFNRWVVFKNPTSWKWFAKKVLWKVFQKPFNYFVELKLAYFIKKHKIDLVHSNSSVVNIGAKAAKISRCKHIWHFREFCQEDFNMYPLDGQQKFLCNIKKYSDKIIAVSDAVKRKYENYLNEGQIVTIYNGISALAEVKHFEHEKFNVLIAGMINEAKGQQIALEAMRKIVQQGVEDIQLFIAGSGNTTALAYEYGDIKNYVHYLGQVDDMQKLRSEMDIEIVCSKCEAFGRVTVEAMMSELPVIGSNSGGTSELIQDGKNGFLFECGNVAQIVDKIIYMYGNREKAVKMGKEARKLGEEKFSIEKCVHDIEKIYEEVRMGYKKTDCA